jgi:manganese-dependent ADP-ribose/CDP-alcohol diphosphatase
MKFLFLVALLFVIEFSQAQSLKIGIIADCQYCDCEFNRDWNNDYRKGPGRLQDAVNKFNSSDVDLVFHLGDFIDRDFKSYETVKPIFNELTMPSYFVLGNHEFSVADSLKRKVLDKLNLKVPYYSVQKTDWLFIVLDGTDVSPYRSSDTKQIELANREMAYYEKLGRPQAKPWNGSLGDIQIAWLEKQLTAADRNNLKVIVLCHFPVLPKLEYNLWNDIEVVKVLERHPSVKAFFNGHHHPGNYLEQDEIHYVTFQGMVRSEDKTAFAVVELSDEVIIVSGEGREPNRTLRVK